MSSRAILRYDGRWDWVTGKPRQWTVLSHWIGPDGQDHFEGSFLLASLVQIGIVPQKFLKYSALQTNNKGGK